MKLKRKPWILLCATGLLLYFGAYLCLRMNHTFVHRAGRYGPRISGNRPRRSTSHFIEPSEPRVDAMIPFLLAEEDDPNYEKMLQEAEQHWDAAKLRQERLLLLFEPAAFLEVCIWKIAQPNPPVPKYR